MNDKETYRMIKYTHDEIQNLLDKVKEHKDFFLTSEQYNKLIKDIGLDNISTFDGSYSNLIDRPIIPYRTDQLSNVSAFQTIKDLESFYQDEIIPIENDVAFLLDYIDELDELKLEDVKTKIEELKILVERFDKNINDTSTGLLDIKIHVENNINAIENLKQLLNAFHDSCNSNKALIDSLFEEDNTIQERLLKIEELEVQNSDDIVEIKDRIYNYIEPGLFTEIPMINDKGEIITDDYGHPRYISKSENLENFVLHIKTQVDTIENFAIK